MSDHFSSSDDNLEEILAVLEVPKTICCFEETVSQLSDHQYLQHFRISGEVTLQLADQFALSQYYHYQKDDVGKVTPLNYITVFLWFAGNEAGSYRDVADCFNIGKSTLYKIVPRVTLFLSNLSPGIIKWPTNKEKTVIEERFRQKGFPGVIAIIDGTHVRIDRLTEDPD